MANLSDAFGKIIVHKVAEEFVEFLNAVQGEGSYYLLADRGDYDNIELIDEDNSMEFQFSTAGRWAYNTNLEGYLEGKWLQDEERKPHYDKFIESLRAKGGSIVIEYYDSDTAMDWMGEGVATLEVVDGEVSLRDDFESTNITIKGFAEQQGESEYWALEYIYGDEVSDAYNKYAEECKEKGVEPVEAEKWFETIYEEE